ncbi:MAG: tetratricopeptide repeat protein [SAR324 cluster bacterium]|nr:tetratricopeptide repeat protein [SAR324 cluster bacterium]
MNKELVRLKKLSLQADELNSSGKIEAARIKIIDGLELAIEIDAQNFFYFFHGELNYLDEHLVAATEHYRKAYELAPQNLLMLRGLGVAYSKRNSFQKAQAIFDRAVKLHPHDHRIWRQRGVTYSKMKEYENALKCFERALDLEPQDYHSYRQRGVTFSKAGKPEEALIMFAKALFLNGNDFRSLDEKSKVLRQFGEEAEAARTRSLSIEIEQEVTRVPPRESLLARIKMNRIRKNQQRILTEFHTAIVEENRPSFK